MINTVRLEAVAAILGQMEKSAGLERSHFKPLDLVELLN